MSVSGTISVYLPQNGFEPQTSTGIASVPALKNEAGKDVIRAIFGTEAIAEREEDGRILASVPDLPGVMAYGVTEIEAVRKVKAIAPSAC